MSLSEQCFWMTLVFFAFSFLFEGEYEDADGFSKFYSGDGFRLLAAMCFIVGFLTLGL